MKSRMLVYFLAVLTVGSLFLSCRPRNVARINNSLIAMNNFEEYLKAERIKKTGLNAEIAKICLNDFIDRRLIIQSAYDDSLHIAAEILEKVKDKEENLVYLQVIRKKVYGQVMPVSEMKELYKEQGLEFGVSHIFIPTDADMTVYEINKARETLNNVYSKLLQGEDFDKLAREYSRDQSTAGKGGWLGFMKWGERGYGDSFYDTLNSMHKGKFSDVIRSKKGFHIVKLKTIRKREQQPFKERLHYLWQDTYGSRGQQVHGAYENFLEDMKRKYNYQEYKNTIDSLMLWFGKTPYEYNMNDDYDKFVNELSAQQKQMPVYKVGDNIVSVNDLLITIRKNLPQGSRPDLSLPDAWDRIMVLDPAKSIVLKYGYKNNYHKKDPVQKTVTDYLENEIYKIQKKRYVNDKVNPSEGEYRAYYADNKQRFEETPKVKVQEIYISGKERAEWLYNRALEGEDFSVLAEKYTERDSVRDRQGVLGYLDPVRHRGLTWKAFRMLEGEISEPVYISNRYSVLKVMDRQPGDPRTFDEVRDQVISVVRQKQLDERYEIWINELRSQNRFAIFDNVLKAHYGTVSE